MQSRRSAGAVMFLVTLFILQSASYLAVNESSSIEVIEEETQIERVHFELRDDVFTEAIGVYNYHCKYLFEFFYRDYQKLFCLYLRHQT